MLSAINPEREFLRYSHEVRILGIQPAGGDEVRVSATGIVVQMVQSLFHSSTTRLIWD
jgi:hypothetical protein